MLVERLVCNGCGKEVQAERAFGYRHTALIIPQGWVRVDGNPTRETYFGPGPQDSHWCPDCLDKVPESADPLTRELARVLREHFKKKEG